MRYISTKFLLLNCILIGSFLKAQIDPAKMAALSKLSPEEKQNLLKQHGSGTKVLPKSNPNSAISNRPVQVEQPDKESFKDRTDFLNNLNSMEKMISADIGRLQSEVKQEGSSEDNELLEALEESKTLLRKIKQLQRREIEKRAEEFGKSEIDAIKPFGYDLFASDPITYAPGNEVPFPHDYIIGIGDTIDVQLYGRLIDSYSLIVNNEGKLNFPGIGPINVFENGTKFIDLKNHLKQKIAKNLGQGVESSITLGGFRSIRIFLLGEVRRQGAYTVSSLSTTINALLSCGGIKESGSLRKIQLKRGGKVVSTLDLYDLLLNGDTSADKSLQPGDVIFVPVIEKQVAISGAVKRPAKYEILGGESLNQVIDLAGGPSARAVLDLIRLERLNSDYRTTVKNLDFFLHKDFVISSGDLISIGFPGSSIKNVVSIIGAVEKVGDYEFKKGLELKDLINSKDDFLSNIDLQYGIIRRKNKDGTYSCIAFRPIELVSENSSPILLQSQDLVYFLTRDKKSRKELIAGLLLDLRNQTIFGRFAKIVRISGAVHFPGEYPLSDFMNLSDLIDAGGGTKDSSYMLDAEISRIVLSSDQIASIEHIELGPNSLTEKNSSKTFQIQPYDVLSIKQIPLWKEGEFIRLSGEFNFPGIYSIKPGETLFEIINRAGGLTGRAFPKGAIFSRENLRVIEDQQRQRLISQLESDVSNATLKAADSADAQLASSAANAILSRLKNTKSQGRLVINLEEMIRNPNNKPLLVKNGDTLSVPQIPYSVSVSGEVQFPTSHMHENNLKLDDYINRSGGFTQSADKDRTFVVKPNGAVLNKSGNAWFGKGKSAYNIESGDMIVIPVNLKQSRVLENLANGTQIIYQLAVAAAAVNSF